MFRFMRLNSDEKGLIEYHAKAYQKRSITHNPKNHPNWGLKNKNLINLRQ